MSKKIKLETEEDSAKEQDQDADESAAIAGLLSSLERPDMRSMALFGEIDEEKASDICVGLLLLSKNSDEEKLGPINFYISTYGGNADDMFSIIDMMDIAKRNCEIRTYGLGKVMSAGVLLLANGTPGSRYVGKHCRIMIHSCNAGSVGDIHNLKNEMAAIQHQQEQYINALVEVSSLTKRQLNRLLDRKVNVYLTATEAIEYGIADEIM